MNIRRRREFLLEALVLVYAFTAAAFHSDWPSISGEPAAMIRLAIPVAAAFAGLRLRDAFSDPEDRAPQASAVDVAIAFGLAFLAEEVLYVLKPSWMLPRWAPTQGGFLGMVLLAMLRSLFAPGALCGATRFYPAAPRVLRAYLAAAALFAPIGLWLAGSGAWKTRIAGGCLILGSAYLVYVYRSNDLRRASYWYYGSLLPAALVLLAGSPVYPYWVPLFIVMAAEVNAREAAFLIDSK